MAACLLPLRAQCLQADTHSFCCELSSAAWPSTPSLPDQLHLPCSEVRKTLIGRAMCERYANHLGLPQYLVLGKSIMGEEASVATDCTIAN